MTIKAAKSHTNMHAKLMTPGLIDCHTHIVYGGDRAYEWELKLKGASYEEVAFSGGGIVNTVDGTRKATVDSLVESAKKRVEALLREGVTSMEIKSGYGLELDAERNQLLAAQESSKLYGIHVQRTFLAAHAIPREYKGKADEYITECIKMMDILAKEGLIDAVDAFCESIAFSVDQTARVFQRAKELGLPIRLHGDQLNDYGGGALAARFGAMSCDHCEYAGDEAIQAMSDGKVVAVLLPTANYFISESKMPALDRFRDKNVDITIATNCNPGSSPCCSILLTMNMACTRFRLSPQESLKAVTLNAAKAMGRSGTVGSIEVGKHADL
jgi:imidazolonepropionase